MKPSLTVVGCGIKFLSHLTTESKSSIEQADIVLYLVNDPVMKEWIQRANPKTESLDELYFKHENRIDSYNSISTYILTVLQNNLHVCVVLYGHPSFFAKPAIEAVLNARNLGYEAKILPGISAEDCLFADLAIDPGSCGRTSYEATDMLIHKKTINPNIHLVIWQISAIGALKHLGSHDNTRGINALTHYLYDYYNPTHKVILYSAAQYPGLNPEINQIPLESLPDAPISPTTTLYIPPISKDNYDIEMLNQLGLTI